MKAIEADFSSRISESVEEKPRILIIDNDGDFTRSAKLGLERTGQYFVCEENDATKAHQTAQRIKPDLVLWIL